MNLSTEKKITDLKNRLVVAKGEREWDGPGTWSESRSHKKERRRMI